MGVDAAEGLIGQVLQGTYRIERQIGEGGMGAVYEASHTRVRRRFAIKVLAAEVASNEEALARFRREAEVTSELGHPHIIEVIDFNITAAGAPYMVMELLQGESLGEHIQREGALPLPRAEAILRQAASALQAAHRHGVIHRDLKPQNLFLCRREDGTEIVKVLDFGISKVKGSRSMMTGTHVVIGTPNYMTPEQAEGRAAQVTERTDVFALGTIVYEMLSGQAPFLADTIPAVLYQVVHVEPPSLASLRPDLPVGARAAVEHALRKRPEERFASVEELASAFATALVSAGVALLGVTALPPVRAGQDLTGPVGPASGGTPPAGGQSTLSSSVGELRAEPGIDPIGPPPRNPVALYALAAFLLAGGLAGGIAYLALRRGPDPRPDPASGDAAGSSRTDQRAVAVKQRPPDATTAKPDHGLALRPDARAKKVEPGVKRPIGKKPVTVKAGPPLTGVINVAVDKPWADLALDGKRIPQGAPGSLKDIPVGRHVVEVTRKGCTRYLQRNVIVHPNKTTIVKATLTCQ